MNPLRLQVKQKIFKLLVNKAERLRRQEHFISDENFLQFVKKIEELESFIDDIFIFEANPQYQIFSDVIEELLEILDDLHSSIIKNCKEKTLLLPSELLKQTIGRIET